MNEPAKGYIHGGREERENNNDMMGVACQLPVVDLSWSAWHELFLSLFLIFARASKVNGGREENRC